jgi:cytochrome c
VYAWVPSVGISNLIRLASDEFPSWKGDLLVSSLNGRTLFRIVLDGDRALVVEPIKIGERIRDLMELPDGRVLLLGDNYSLIILELAQSVLDGEALFTAWCAGCHGLGQDGDGNGPDLAGVMGRPVASLAGYDYSKSMKKIPSHWNFKKMDSFLTDPQAYAPGNDMEFAPLDDPEVRFALIDYLLKQ